MKHSIRNMFKVILVVIMLLLLPAVGNKTAAEGEPEQEPVTYDISFIANGKMKTVVGVELPYEFNCEFWIKNGELDAIIKELYELGPEDRCKDYPPTLVSGGDDKVTVGVDESKDDQYIRITEPFAAPAVISGEYCRKTGEGDSDEAYEAFTYNLIVKCAEHRDSFVSGLGTTAGGTVYYEIYEDETTKRFEGGGKANTNVPNGGHVVFTATPEEGFAFAGWYEGTFGDTGFIEDHTDKKVGSNTTITIDIDSIDKNVQAVFYKIVVVDVGAGHTDLAAAAYDELPAENCIAYNDTILTLKYPLSDEDGPLNVSDMLWEIIFALNDVLPENDFDNNERFIDTGLKTADKYDSYAELNEEYKYAKTVNLSDVEGTLKIYALWAKQIDKVDITVEAPVGGTKVTGDPDEIDTQKPYPQITVPDSCRVMTVKPNPEEPHFEERPKAYWFEEDGNKSFFGTIRSGNTYVLFSIIEPKFEYDIAEDAAITLNGEDLAKEHYEVYPPEFLNWLEIHAPIEAVSPEGGDYFYNTDNAGIKVWKEGMTGTLDFEFDYTGQRDPFDSRDKVLIDGKETDKYESERGSWIIKLKPELLETLSEGNHTVEAVFTDYEGPKAVANFTILKKDRRSGGDDSDSSKPVYRLPLTGVE